MAKLFYSLEEAAQRLGKTHDEVKAMASSGQLQEFRDRDRLVFKREQVDLLAGGGDDDALGNDPLGGSSIGLADSSPGPLDLGDLDGDAGGGAGLGDASGSHISLADSGLGDLNLEASGSQPGIDLGNEGGLGLGASGSGLDAGGLDSGEFDSGAGDGQSTGISIFDADEADDADPSAQTQISDDLGYTPEFAMQDAGSSGSGLLDLTREADDTSLGANLLDDLYGGKDSMGEDEAAQVGDESALFESTGAESDVSTVSAAGVAGGGVLAFAEPYDGTWSGILGGVSLGMVLTLALVLTVSIFSMLGMGAGLLTLIAGNPLMWVGVCAGVIVVFAIVGLLLGKRSG